MAEENEITQLLLKWNKGDQSALEELMPLVYGELRKIAERYLRRERPDHTLQSSALVNEAYLKLINQKHMSWESRTHFFAIAAKMMRRILIDYARGRNLLLMKQLVSQIHTILI
jgi:RNA polymerase sigma factor (TIGR02999 family)